MSVPSPTDAFGQAVRQLRHEIGLSQEGLALRSDLDRSYVGGVERGERNPSLRSILKLAAGLGVPPSVLFRRYEQVTCDPDKRDGASSGKWESPISR